MGELIPRRVCAFVLAGLTAAIIGCGGGGSSSGGTNTGATTTAGFQALGGPGAGSGVGQFNQPNEVAFNAAGTKMYITDGLNNRLVEVDVSSTLNTSGWTAFGSTGTGVNQFGGIAGRIGDVAVDASGRIYITDPGNNRIVRIDNMTGAGWTTFGTAGTGVGQFSLVSGIALDAAGRIYVTDETANRVVRMDDMTGAGWTELGILAGGNGVGQFDSPVSIAIRNTGLGERIYVADRDNNRIVQMTDMTGGGWATFSTGAQIQDQPGGVSVDSSGRIYFTQFFRHRIVRIDTIAGGGFRTFGSLGNGTNQFQNPFATSIDLQNRIYITDRSNNRLTRIDQIP
jgi:sugar lactone lactonase YvrE